LSWIVGIFAALIATLFIYSFYLDGMIRARTQAAMNQKLKGYHVGLAHAHLQLVGGILTLNGLKVVQQAHPHPAVADVTMMRFHIEWKELFSRRLVADVLLSHPKVHIDQTQLVTENKDPVPLRQKGWQDALEALTGSRQMDATAILDYFAPLDRWLAAQNKGETCGW